MARWLRPASLGLWFLLTACGSLPPTAQPTPVGGGGGPANGGAIAPEPLSGAIASAANATPGPTAVARQPVAGVPVESGSTPRGMAATLPPASPPASFDRPVAVAPPPGPLPASAASSGPGSAQPTPAPTTAPTPSVAPTPSPLPTSRPTPAPSDAAPTALVDTAHALFTQGKAQYVGGVLVVHAIDRRAFDNTPRGLPFPALAGVVHTRYGWNYARIASVDEANHWSADMGNPGPVTFLDSSDGTADNSGGWHFQQSAGGQSADATASATENLTLWDPVRAASLALGNTDRDWTVLTEGVRRPSPDQALPGVFVVFTRPDGSRDFVIASGQAQTIRAHGYAYAFYLTDGSQPAPDQADRLTLRPAP